MGGNSMAPSGLKFFALFFASAAFACTACGQDKPANIAYVYPAGVKRGVTTSVLLGGENMKDASAVFVSGGGVKCKISQITIPPDTGKLVGLRNGFEKKYIEDNPEVGQELKKAAENEDPKVIAQVRRKIREAYLAIPENAQKLREANEQYYLRYVTSDPLAETVEVEISVDESAEPGERNISILTPAGLSNCATIVVSDTREFVKPSLRQTAKERVKRPEYWSGSNLKTWKDPYFFLPSEREVYDVEIPVVVNGQIVEAKTDFYRFFARRGQKIVAAVWAQSLLAYISDAVPGWFQTVLTLRDSNGKEIAYNDDFEHRPDSLLVADIPEDGYYILEIRDAIYRSREDFVYRILLGEVPFVKSIFPLGFNAANELRPAADGAFKSAKFKFSGVNLPVADAVLGADAFGKILGMPSGFYSKDLSLDVRRVGTVLSDSEKGEFFSGTSGGVQRLTVPVVVDGRITERTKNTGDVYSFYAKAGEKLVLEVFARRLGSPLDSVLELCDSSGKVLATADDFEDLSCGLVTHHADSRLEFTPEKSGLYKVRIADSRGEGSASHAYRLSIAEPSPDFELRADPANINIRPHETVSLRVTAFRKDGMDAPIKLELKNLPAGFKVSNAVIPKGKNYVHLMITAPEKFDPQMRTLELTGTAECGGKTISRRAVPCQEMMQAFYYLHFVPCAELTLSANAFAGYSRRYSGCFFDYEKIQRPFKIPLEGRTRLAVGYTRGGSNVLSATFLDPVDGIKIAGVYADKKSKIIYVDFECDSSKVKLGQKGEFCLSIKGRAGRDFLDICRIPPVNFEITDTKEGKKFLAKQWTFTENLRKEMAKKPRVKPKKNVNNVAAGEKKTNKNGEVKNNKVGGK